MLAAALSMLLPCSAPPQSSVPRSSWSSLRARSPCTSLRTHRVWHFAPPLFPIARVLGAALIVAGLPILLDSFARFALQGLGTPAPVMPPKRLVVTGFYRYVRNPMYVAVTALIAGQGLLFGSVTVLEYGAIVWARVLLVRCCLRRACAGRAVRRRVQALPGEREAMVTAHHPMAWVGGKNAACASSSSIAAATTMSDDHLVWKAAIRGHYSITLSARNKTDCGIVIPIAFAVFRFTTSSNLVGWSTGRSPGFVPLRILST